MLAGWFVSGTSSTILTAAAVDVVAEEDAEDAVDEEDVVVAKVAAFMLLAVVTNHHHNRMEMEPRMMAVMAMRKLPPITEEVTPVPRWDAVVTMDDG